MLNWQYVETGESGKCPIKVHYGSDVHRNMEVMLFDRNGIMLNKFGKTIGSNGYKAVCGDLVDAKLSLYSMSTSWGTTSIEVASLDLNGVNGHDITVSIETISSGLI